MQKVSMNWNKTICTTANATYLEITQRLNLALCEDFITTQNPDIASFSNDTIFAFASRNVASPPNVEYLLDSGRSDILSFRGWRQYFLHSTFNGLNGIISMHAITKKVRSQEQ
jgi:hypothetical protein